MKPACATAPEMLALVEETLEAFFALRRAGQRLGAVTEQGRGWWGLMRLVS